MSRSLQVYIPQNDWSDLFWFLADQTKEGRVVILLAEISWMIKDPTFLGKLWDKHFKKNEAYDAAVQFLHGLKKIF
jgi:hypothetical protein